MGVKESEFLTTTTAKKYPGTRWYNAATRKPRESESEQNFLARFLFPATFPRLSPAEDFYSSSPHRHDRSSQPTLPCSLFPRVAARVVVWSMIFAIAIPQLFGFERSSEDTTTTTLTKDGGMLLAGWLDWCNSISSRETNRCVCVWRARRNDTVGVWVGAWLFIFSTQPAPVLSSAVRCYSLPPPAGNFFFALLNPPTTIQPHTRPPHLDIPWKRRTRGHKALVACFGISLIIIIIQWHRTVTAIVYRRRQSAS